MHYCLNLITEEFPTDNVIEDILCPFNENEFYEKYYDEENDVLNKPEPSFLWDWYTVGGRYSGLLKLKVDTEDSSWWYIGKKRNGKLFRNNMLTRLENQNIKYYDELDCMVYMGLKDGYLIVDACPIKELYNEDELSGGFYFIGKDKKVHTRYDYVDGKKIIDKNYESDFKKELEKNEDCYLTILDIHD